MKTILWTGLCCKENNPSHILHTGDHRMYGQLTDVQLTEHTVVTARRIPACEGDNSTNSIPDINSTNSIAFSDYLPAEILTGWEQALLNWFSQES